MLCINIVIINCFATESDRKGISSGIYRKTPNPSCDDVISIHTRQSATRKLFPSRSMFYGQQRLCLALCTVYYPHSTAWEGGRQGWSEIGYCEISKEMSSLYFGLDVFCQIKARIPEPEFLNILKCNSAESARTRFQLNFYDILNDKTLN